MRIDSAGRVGIGVTPSSGIQLEVGNSTNSSAVSRVTNGTVSVDLTASSSGKVYLEVGTNHPLIFATNATERLRIDASGNLLVGKTSAGFANTGHELRGGGSYAAFTRDGGSPVLVNRKTSDGTLVEYMKDNSTVGQINARSSDLVVGTGDTGLQFYDVGDAIFPLSASGNTNRDGAIDLGESSNRFKDLWLSGTYHVNSGGTGKIQGTNDASYFPIIGSGTSGSASIYLNGATRSGFAGHLQLAGTNTVFFNETLSQERMRIDSAGNVGIGTTAPSAKMHVIGDIATSTRVATDTINGYTGGSTPLTIQTGGAQSIILGTNGSERMRIDSSGNLLVGTTSSDAANDGIRLKSYGQLSATNNNDIPLSLNRRSSDGTIAQFRKDNSVVGSIGTSGGDLIVNASGGAGVLQASGTGQFAWTSNIFYPITDNAKDLGTASFRFDDIYATNGTIQTSDRNEKQDIAELSEAEQRVAVAAKGLLRKFRWKDSVAEKGDDARIHFGIIAQDLQAAFEAEGLDAGDYAMFISTTWTDEETNEEKTRMGVRYSELLAFIISAI